MEDKMIDKTKQKGPLFDAIQKASGTNMIVLAEQTGEQLSYRKFYSKTFDNDFKKEIKEDKNLYDLSLYGNYSKFYMDIDIKKEEEEEGFDMSFIYKIIYVVDNLFKRINKQQSYSIYSSNRKDKGGYKYSYHLIFHTIFFNESNQAKEFIKGIELEGLDQSVYSRKRLFRLPGQSKFKTDKSQQVPLGFRTSFGVTQEEALNDCSVQLIDGRSYCFQEQCNILQDDKKYYLLPRVQYEKEEPKIRKQNLQVEKGFSYKTESSLSQQEMEKVSQGLQKSSSAWKDQVKLTKQDKDILKGFSKNCVKHWCSGYKQIMKYLGLFSVIYHKVIQEDKECVQDLFNEYLNKVIRFRLKYNELVEWLKISQYDFSEIKNQHQEKEFLEKFGSGLRTWDKLGMIDPTDFRIFNAFQQGKMSYTSFFGSLQEAGRTQKFDKETIDDDFVLDDIHIDLWNRYSIGQVVNYFKQKTKNDNYDKKIMEESEKQKVQEQEMVSIKRYFDIQEHQYTVSTHQDFIKWDEYVDRRSRLIFVDGVCSAGKSYSTIKWMQNQEINLFFFITVRNSLRQQQINDYQEAGFHIISKENIQDYKDPSQFMKLGKKVVCIYQFESCHAIQDLLKKIEEQGIEYQSVFDESESLNTQYISAFHLHNKSQNYDVIKQLQTRSNTCVLMDANLQLKSIEHMIQKYPGVAQFIECSVKKKYENVYVQNSLSDMEKDIINRYENRDVFNVVCSSLGQCQMFQQSFQKIDKERGGSNQSEEFLCVTSDTPKRIKEEAMKDVTKYMKDNNKRVLIHNGSMMAGVNCNVDTQDLFVIMDGQDYTTDQQMYQMISRTRKARNIHICFQRGFEGQLRFDFLRYINYDNIHIINPVPSKKSLFNKINRREIRKETQERQKDFIVTMTNEGKNRMLDKYGVDKDTVSIIESYVKLSDNRHKEEFLYTMMNPQNKIQLKETDEESVNSNIREYQRYFDTISDLISLNGKEVKSQVIRQVTQRFMEQKENTKGVKGQIKYKFLFTQRMVSIMKKQKDFRSERACLTDEICRELDIPIRILPVKDSHLERDRTYKIKVEFREDFLEHQKRFLTEQEKFEQYFQQ